MATLTFTPEDPVAGTPVTVDGDGFDVDSFVEVAIVEQGGSSIEFDIPTDAAGGFGSTDEADYATATLTLAGNAVADETVTIGAVVYTWKTTPTTVANEVKVGASASVSLDNLKAAINLAAGSGSLYGSDTVVHPTVEAETKTATTLKLRAKTAGTGGNALASTETMTNGSFGDTTFADTGAVATGRGAFRFTPGSAGVYTITASDGTNSVSEELQVWKSG